MKKVLLLLTVLLAFTLSGCDEKEEVIEYKDSSMLVEMFEKGIVYDEDFEVPAENETFAGEGNMVLSIEDEIMAVMFGDKYIIVLDFYYVEKNGEWIYIMESVGYITVDYSEAHYIEMEGYLLNDTDEGVIIDYTPEQLLEHLRTFEEKDYINFLEEIGMFEGEIE